MRPGGFRSAFFVDGDFEAITEFQVQRVAIPGKGSGAGLVLKVEFDQGGSTVALACVRKRDNSWAMRGNFSDDSGEHQPFEFSIPRAATRIAIAREGRTLKFRRDLGGGKLEEFHTYQPTSPERSRGRIILMATSGGSDTAMQMRVQSVLVHTQQANIGTRAKPPAERGWIIAACAFASLAACGLIYRGWSHRTA